MGRAPAEAGIAHQRQDFFTHFLAELHAPLIERIDAPDHALRENLVFVQRHQTAERARIESLERDDAHGTIARMDLVAGEKFDAFRRQLARRELGDACSFV